MISSTYLYKESQVIKTPIVRNEMILEVQAMVEKGASKEKIGLRGPMPPGMLFALYYSGRENPPHPEIWVNYFLRMVELYSKKVFEVSKGAQEDDLDGSLSYLSTKEKEMLRFLLEKRLMEFTPIDVSKMLGVTNKTVINRCARLTNHGFLVPNIVSQRIRSYSLSKFAKQNQKRILAKIPVG